MSIVRDNALEWIKACANVLAENRDYLTQLDAAIGDADHGANMDRGFKAVINKMPEFSTAIPWARSCRARTTKPAG